jgi:hypothetical protein
MVRAKLTVTSITEHHNLVGKTIKLHCIYDPTIPEDRRFSEATPNGSMEIFVTNPAALEQFTKGKTFYVDFTPVEG